jgi:hypothetical protein
MTGKISISEIYQAISSLDPDGAYRQVSYNLTSRNTLNPNPAWWVFIPYGQWSNPLQTPNPSPFETAVLQAIPSGTSNECFIDIVSLGTQSNFFSDPNASQTIVGQLAKYINNLPPTVTPIIRYLEGNLPGAQPDPSNCGIIQNFYKGNPITHPNASFYYGSFAPGFQFVSEPSAPEIGGIWDSLEAELKKLWEWLVAEIKKYSQEFYQEIIKIETEIISWIKRFIEHVVISSVSWNHAKIFALNGTYMVTGGANYWPAYTTGQTWLFDLGMSITGDATIDAHRFANYLWRYLGNIPPTDKSSWSMGNLLTNPISGFQNASAPIFSNFPQNSGGVSALSVGKNGNWPFQDLGFPAQIFDAARDFTLNVIAVMVETHISERVDWTAFVAKVLSDDNPDFRNILKEAGINTTAWASRYARNYTVSQAQKSVRFSQQKFVMDDLVTHASYMTLVADINLYLKCTWNGYIWPYDMLMSLGSALSNMSHNPTRLGTGIEIVTSCPSTAEGGYEDPVTVEVFTGKLAGIMGGMQVLGYIHPAGGISAIISNFLFYRRIDNSTTAPSHGNHAKLVIVDDAVCYIGSDNAYPSYNEEFGLWIDDEPSIQSLINEYWNDLWTFAQPGS